jgi:hypothetical protein
MACSTTVVLAISSPILRARLASWLKDVAALQVVGEAETGAQVADIVAVAAPAFVLCDRLMLADPELAEILTFLGRKPEFIMIAVNNENPPSHTVVPVAQTISYNVRGSELARRLGANPDLSFAAANEPPAGKVLDFSLHSPGHSSPERRVSSVRTMPREARSAKATQTGRLLSAPKLRLASALLALQLNPWHYPLDAVTGMVGPAALEKALSILQEVQHPSAFIEIEVRDPEGNMFRADDADPAMLRHMALSIRATVRHYDLLCRTAAATFTLVLPDLLEDAAATRLQQLRLALGSVCLAHLDTNGPPQVHITAGFWLPGMDPAQVLSQCRRSMPGKPPAPTKTAQLARTSFFKSVFDVPASSDGVVSTH